MDPGQQKGLGSTRGAHQLVPCFKARPCGLKQGEHHHGGKGGSRRQNGPRGHHHQEEEVLSWDLANPRLRQSPRPCRGARLCGLVTGQAWPCLRPEPIHPRSLTAGRCLIHAGQATCWF